MAGLTWHRLQRIERSQQLRETLEGNKAVIIEALNAGETMTAVAARLDIEMPLLSAWLKKNTRKRWELK